MKTPTNAISSSGDISRTWAEFMVKPVFSENKATQAGTPWPERSESEIRNQQAKVMKGIECHIYVLPTPIVMKTDEVKAIVTVKDGDRAMRFYPPFAINERGETSGALEEVLVPQGLHEVTTYATIPHDAVKGVRVEPKLTENTHWCRGLRIDVEAGANVTRAVRLLTDQICQYTHQWWLRATQNPFLGMKRFGAMVTKDFGFIDVLRYRGAREVESTWYGAVQHQPHLGIGSPLTRGLWLLACHHVSEKREADSGLLAFHDGFANYMAEQDEKCILNLCIAVEILLSKHQLGVLKKPLPTNLETLVKTTPMLDASTKAVLKKLVVDRGHVAHGKTPYYLGRDPDCSLENYIGAVRKVISSYLQCIQPGTWPDIMTMKIPRPRQNPV